MGSDLHTAAVDGDVELVKALLKPNQNGQVLDVNAAAKDGQRMTPLMLASRYGNLQVMEERMSTSRYSYHRIRVYIVYRTSYSRKLTYYS